MLGMNSSNLRIFIQNFFCKLTSKSFNVILFFGLAFYWFIPVWNGHSVVSWHLPFGLLGLVRLHTSKVVISRDFCIRWHFGISELLLLLWLFYFKFLNSIFNESYGLSNFHVFDKFFIIQFVGKINEVIYVFVFFQL